MKAGINAITMLQTTCDIRRTDHGEELGLCGPGKSWFEVG